MRFIDREQSDVQMRQPIHHAVRQQSLRRYIEQIKLLLDQIARDRACFGLFQSECSAPAATPSWRSAAT